MSRLIFDASTLGGTTTLSSEDAVGNFTIDVPAKTGTLLIPSTVGLAGQALISNATTAPTWQYLSGVGTVVSVNVSGGTTGLTTSGGPITGSGTITLAGTLAIANGGTGATSAATALTALGAYPASNPSGFGVGSVTSVAGTGTVNGLTLTGTVTTSGSLTLGGTLSLVSPPAIGSTAPNTGAFTTLTSSTSFVPTAYTETVVASGTVGASATLAITAGTILTATLTSATACTFTMPTATAGKSFTLLLKQPASGTATTATFTGVKWNSGGAPTITATVGKLDIIAFVADGTNWYGTASQGYTY